MQVQIFLTGMKGGFLGQNRAAGLRWPRCGVKIESEGRAPVDFGLAFRRVRLASGD